MTRVREWVTPPPDAEMHELRGARPHDRARWLLVGLLVLLLLGLWALAAGATAASAYRNLHDARTTFREAESHLRAGDVDMARVVLSASIARADEAATGLRRAHIAPLRLAPLLGPNLRAATALGEAAAETGKAAERLLVEVEALAGSGGSTSDNEVSLARVHDLAPPLRQLGDALQASMAEVDASESRWLVAPLADARATYLESTSVLAEQVAVAGTLLEAMPAMLGDHGPRAYLVGAASLSELRASGGLLGSWTLLTAEGSELAFDDFSDIDALASADEDVTAPSSEYAERYRALGSLRQWRNVNLTPDFPSSARVMLELWEAQGGAPLDGAIVVDPVVFARLAKHSGELEIPGHGEVNADDVLRFVALDAYAAFDDEDERKRVLGAVATASFTRLFDVLEGGDLVATIETLHGLVEGGHLRMYSTDPQVQAAFERAGITGALPAADGEMAGVFVNNVAGNKVDWFAGRRIEHHVQLLPDGVTRATVTVELDNRAPRDGLPRHVLGPWTPVTEAGDSLSLVSILCGTGCVHDLEPRGVTDGGSELGQPVADVRLLVPAGQRRVLAHRTQTAGGWEEVDGEIVLNVAHVLQPALHPTALRVRVTPPPGWVFAERPSGAELVDGDLRWETEGSGVVGLRFELARTPRDPADATVQPGLQSPLSSAPPPGGDRSRAPLGGRT
jgi:hypothetical protein